MKTLKMCFTNVGYTYKINNISAAFSQGVPMNNLAPMKNCPGGGVQGKLNLMPG